MAYATVTSLNRAIDQLLPMIGPYFYLCRKEQMKSLREKISRLQEFLEYISLRPPVPEYRVFESRIRDTSHKMEDIIELVIMSYKEPVCCVEFLSYIFNSDILDAQLPTPDEFGSCFEEVHVLLEEAMEMIQTIDDNAILEAVHPLTTTTLLVEAPGFDGTKVGLDKPLNQILDQVTGEGSMLKIVPITGMGGIGKTTLARAFYEAPQARSHFDLRFWVTVSQDHNIQEILRELLPKAEQNTVTDEKLIEEVHKYLKCRRYLIILDDMWDENVWDQVMIACPDDYNGSRVIITTRLLGVASYVGLSSSVHKMQFLNEDQSWELLRETVYGHEYCSTEFEGIGRTIAKNCKGLPLAIVITAGLLKFDKTRNYWEQVARNTDEKVIPGNDHLFEILSWSYTRLPPHLKACFLYMGAFKEDYDIPTKELVRLWIAEGFLKPKQSRSMEEVAEECLQELVERSLVLVTKRRCNGKIGTCSVHDIIREVSIQKAEKERFLCHVPRSSDEYTVRNTIAVQRRVSISNNVKVPSGTSFVTPRSLINRGMPGFEFMSIIQCFKLLRVLNRVRIEKGFWISNLCTLTNLKYLHLEFNWFVSVPESISKLQNLETLIVSSTATMSRGILVFPLEIWKLQRLRHIIAMGESDLHVPVPDRICPSLLTLSWVRNINLTESFSQRIPNLKKLKLTYTDEGQEFSMDNLKYLEQLEELSILCSFSRRYDGPRPTHFIVSHNLKTLSFCGTRFPVEHITIIGSLPILKVLKLKSLSVIGKEWKPIEGEFLQLEHLKMEDLQIRHWRVESTHFPCLRKLVILECYDLEEVPESIGEIYTLETLIVKGGRKEAKTSVQTIKEIQQDEGNEMLRVIIL